MAYRVTLDSACDAVTYEYQHDPMGIRLTLRSKVVAWLLERNPKLTSYNEGNQGVGIWVDDRMIISFEDANEALLFKLTWGGQ